MTGGRRTAARRSAVRRRLLVVCAIDPDPGDPLRRCTGQSRFLGEAGLWLARRGVDLICAEPGAATGYRPVPGAWEPATVEAIDAVFDRDHRRDRGAQHAWLARGVPVANPPAFHALCDDKLAFARWARGAGLPVPETVPAGDDAWRSWGAAYAKPRHGRMGAGVHRLAAGEAPRGAVVQRAVEPREAGESIRLLLQRTPGGPWTRAGAFRRVARAGADVVGLATGAEARPLRAEQRPALDGVERDSIRALAAAPDADLIVEVGIDVVLGRDGPAVLEWNARPGRSFERIGRDDLRCRAQRRPFEVLLGWVG